MKSMKGIVWCLSLALCFAAFGWSSACTPEAPKSETPTGQDGGGGADNTGKKTWSQMTYDEKNAYMANTVMPAMKKMFQDYDGTKFANFSCGTCHGEGFAAKKFKMPNGIHPLTPGNFDTEDPKFVKFMQEKVTPEMAKLLDMPVYDPNTQKGFGCFGCHGTKQ